MTNLPWLSKSSFSSSLDVIKVAKYNNRLMEGIASGMSSMDDGSQRLSITMGSLANFTLANRQVIDIELRLCELLIDHKQDIGPLYWWKFNERAAEEMQNTLSFGLAGATEGLI